MSRFTYRRRHLQFLRDNAHKKPAQVTDEFNAHFGTNVPKSSIINARKNHSIGRRSNAGATLGSLIQQRAASQG